MHQRSVFKSIGTHGPYKTALGCRFNPEPVGRVSEVRAVIVTIVRSYITRITSIMLRRRLMLNEGQDISRQMKVANTG